MRFLMGIAIGLFIADVYPDWATDVKNVFIDSGARDIIIDNLKGIGQ